MLCKAEKERLVKTYTLDFGPFKNGMAKSCIDISMLLKVMYYFKKVLTIKQKYIALLLALLIIKMASVHDNVVKRESYLQCKKT